MTPTQEGEEEIVITPPPPPSKEAVRRAREEVLGGGRFDEDEDEEISIEDLHALNNSRKRGWGEAPDRVLAEDGEDEDAEDEDAEDEVEIVEKPRPSKKARKRGGDDAPASVETSIEPSKKVVLLIPNVSSEGARRKTLSFDTDYDDALSVIYATIGCANVQKKPRLGYKFSSAAQKTQPIDLSSEDDWTGMLEDLRALQKKKKMGISVNLSVGPEAYMASLRNHLKNGKATQRSEGGWGGGGTGRKKGKVLMMDLGDNDDDEDDGNGMMEKENKAYGQLEKVLTKCQLCGPTKFCKINKVGEHVCLSFQQRRGWAVALASGAHGVTLQNPPKSELFRDFSSHPLLSSKSAVSSPAVAPPGFMTPQAMGQPYMFPWYMPPAPGYPGGYPPTPTPMYPPPHQQPQPPPAHGIPSSDGFDDTYANPYPEINAFITKLSEKQPRRQLTKHIADFDVKDYYNIDQLAKITTDRLSGPEFGMTSGNAEFLLDAVRAEIKKIDRVHGKKRA